MGFHKRYIDDDQVIDIYREQGNKGVIDWFTRGVDALVTTGQLSMDITDILYTNKLTEEEKYREIDMMVSMASIKKLKYEKEEKTTTSS
jgi:hypothetical protein